MSDNQNLKNIIKDNKIPNLAQWSNQQKEELLKALTSNHKAQYIQDLIEKNSDYISLEQLEKVTYQSITLSNSTIIHKIIDIISFENKKLLMKKAIEIMLDLNKLEMLYKILRQFPSIFKFIHSLDCASLILDMFCFNQHIPGLKFILEKGVSDNDINFYCRRAAKDNVPEIAKIFISGYAQKFEPMTQGVVLINLAHFGQLSLLKLFFDTIKFDDNGYLERALVKAVRHGHVESVEYILSQPIKWTEELLERAIDAALMHKQDGSLFKIIAQKNSLLSTENIQNLTLDAYANNCIDTVHLIVDKHRDKVSNRTKGELLLFATRCGDNELVKKLIPLVKKSKPSYKKQAYLISLQQNNGLQMLFENAYHGIENTITKDELNENGELGSIINNTLTFQFSRLKIRKELVKDLDQTKKPTKCAVMH